MRRPASSHLAHARLVYSITVRFQVLHQCPDTGARYGLIETAHGTIETPAFMPVGTQATVKGVTIRDLVDLRAPCLLANTYHLALRPGADLIARLGGLHKFMGWDGPLLTDSGGYQVFSLAHRASITEEGVTFLSHVDGRHLLLTPEEAVRIQEHLGADIAMVLDECLSPEADVEQTLRSIQLTHRWAERCLRARSRPDQAMFAIVQGGVHLELREASAIGLAALPFDGYAVGGLSVGEGWDTTWRILGHTLRFVPHDRPRYLMGVGSPEDIVQAVSMGIDLFDSALPTRVGRNGALFAPGGRIDLRRARFRHHEGPAVPGCCCSTCQRFSAAYLHHLFLAGEPLAARLATIHNLHFLLELMKRVRAAICQGQFDRFRRMFRPSWRTASC